MSSRRQKKKGWLLPDPVTGYDLLEVCLKIPDTPLYRQAFYGCVWELTRNWNWERSGVSGDHRAADAATYWRGILFDNLKFGEDCMSCFQMRNNPEDSCLIQTSCDGGETWTDAFRLDVCQPYAPTLISINNTNVQILQQQILNRYDGENPNSINPDAPNDNYTGDGSAERLNALCMAAKGYVVAVVADFHNRAALALGLSGVLAVFTVVPFIGIPVLVAAAALALISADAFDATNDEDAINKVICCMVDGLTGQTLNRDNFEHSLDGCGFDEGSHEGILHDVVAAGLGDEASWAAFVNGLGQAYVAALAGVEDCPDCPDDCNERLGSFDNADMESVAISTCPPADYIEVEDGNHYQGTLSADNHAYLYDVRIAVDNSRPVTSITIGGGYYRNAGGGENLAILYADGVEIQQISLPENGEQEAYTIAWTGSMTMSEIKIVAGVYVGDLGAGAGIGLGNVEWCY